MLESPLKSDFDDGIHDLMNFVLDYNSLISI